MGNLIKWLAAFRAAMVDQYGRATGNVIVTLFVALVLIYVGFMFIGQFTGIIGNITAPEGIVGTFFTLGQWLIPVLAIVGLIIYGVTHFLGGGGGGGGRRRRK